MHQATQIDRRRDAKAQATDPLAALRADPAFRAADAATRQWLIALLMRGEAASSETAGTSPAQK